MDVKFIEPTAESAETSSKPKGRRGGRTRTGGMWKEKYDQILALPIAEDHKTATWFATDLETKKKAASLTVATYRWAKLQKATDWKLRVKKDSDTRVSFCRVKPTSGGVWKDVYAQILALPLAENPKEASWFLVDTDSKKRSVNLVVAVYHWAKLLEAKDWKVRTRRDSETQISFCRIKRKVLCATPCSTEAAETPCTPPAAPCVAEGSLPCPTESKEPCEAPSAPTEAVETAIK